MKNRTGFYRASAVFVPGGMPNLTYVNRAERRLEERIEAAKDNLCKLVTITGSTKSGKTVLVNRVFPRENAIWIDGGTVGTEEDFWSYVLESLDGCTTTNTRTASQNTQGISGGAQAQFGLPAMASATFGGTGQSSQAISNEESRSLSLTPRAAAISQLRKHKMPLIIDDFHYLERPFQGNIIRALKPLIFEGMPVVLIAIPHRRYDAIKVEREMTGRLEPVNIPSWTNKELLEIPAIGFPLLKVKVNDDIVLRFSNEAYGSPHLMQEFCRELCVENSIVETAAITKTISRFDENLFRQVADQTGKVIFERLAKGPRQRSDRIQRKLKSGDTADIYEVTLLALSHMRPGLDTIEYESLRSSIRDILDSDIPQAHEVTRVLEKMAEIASSDEASTPVIDWEKEEQKLHITDPFFAYYLKWGSIND